ncbi:type II toxin-antitoxin system HipA family toxin [bacterium]|jgi:serine/threonine-protein kinase HipA|nr:type II toxin-antitoxin system HipA family toxin [bacterium]
MGIAPELKYQQEGGPNLKRCFALVKEISSMPGVDLLRLFDAVIFNQIIGNNDAHGKNFSFLYHESETRLAPLYDLVCTQAYPDLSDEMAMKIGGERKPSRLRQRNWEKFFEEAGLSFAAASKRRKALCLKVKKALEAWPQTSETESKVIQVITGNFN